MNMGVVDVEVVHRSENPRRQSAVVGAEGFLPVNTSKSTGGQSDKAIPKEAGSKDRSKGKKGSTRSKKCFE